MSTYVANLIRSYRNNARLFVRKHSIIPYLAFVIVLFGISFFGLKAYELEQRMGSIRHDITLAQDTHAELRHKVDSATLMREELEQSLNQLESNIQEHSDAVSHLSQQAAHVKAMNEKLIEEKSLLVEQRRKQEEASQAASRGDKIAYLTFDDGPSENTKQILSILNENDIKATFFVTGKPKFKSLYKDIINAGHTIGNHTYSHKYSEIYASVNGFDQDFDRLQQFLYDTIGQKPDLIRFPGGSKNKTSDKYGGPEVMAEIIAEKKAEGYTYFDWNVDSTDGLSNDKTKDEIVDTVLAQSKKKTTAVILFHDSEPKKSTVEALPAVIKGLKEMGFHFDVLTNATKLK